MHTITYGLSMIGTLEDLHIISAPELCFPTSDWNGWYHNHTFPQQIINRLSSLTQARLNLLLRLVFAHTCGTSPTRLRIFVCRD